MTEEVAAPGPIDFSVAPAAAPTPVVAEIAAPAAAVPVNDAAPPATEPAPVAAEAPAVEAKTEPEPAAAEAKPAEAEAEKAPERPKTLLEKADEERAAKEADAKAKKDDKADAKPADDKAKPEDSEKPAAEAEADAPLTFEIPKQLKADPEQIAAFSDILRSTKTGDLKESGQKLLDMHAKALESFATQYAKQTSENQWKVWNDLIAAKDKEVLADPVIGGAGHDTAMAAIVRMRDLAVPESERKAFTDFLNVTGAGSWPPFLRMMYRFAEMFDEPPMPAPGGKPPKDAHIQQPNGKFALLHDHPTSQTKRD